MTVTVTNDRKADALETLLSGMSEVTVSRKEMELASLWEVGPIEYASKEAEEFARQHPSRLVRKQEDGTWKTLKVFQ
jgi:hypothetical protein